MSDSFNISMAHGLIRFLYKSNLVGYWKSNFISDEHIWSSGLYDILGCSDLKVRADYRTLSDILNSEQGIALPKFKDLVYGAEIDTIVVRYIRPDRVQYLLQCSGRTYYAPDGRLVSAVGIIINISNQDLLMRAQESQKRQQEALFKNARIFTHSVHSYPPKNIPSELVVLTGISADELKENLHLAEVPSERSYWKDYFSNNDRNKKPFVALPTLIMSDKTNVPFEIISVPVIKENSEFLEWSIMLRPANISSNIFVKDFRVALEYYISGIHIRAARSLLDWSMSDLAILSGVSVSTIRRLEDDSASRSDRSKVKVVETLRRFGVKFALAEAEIFISKSAK